MSVTLPEVVDAWRMVSACRAFAGLLPLAAMPRLGKSLADTQGTCSYEVEFGRDSFGTAFVDIRVRAGLPLICQRTLERFELPVSIEQRMGLIRDEREEAALLPGYEAVLIHEDARLCPAELIEDELILVVPVVPVKPGTATVESAWSAIDQAALDEQPNPFAALSVLKGGRSKQNQG